MKTGRHPMVRDITVLTETSENVAFSVSNLMAMGRIITEARVLMNLKNKVSL